MWLAPRSTHLVVSRPSMPTGPRCAARRGPQERVGHNALDPCAQGGGGRTAWMRAVLMPTSAPRPKRYPSAKRVLALWKTHALSTALRKCSATAASSVTTASVCALECVLIN